MRHFLIIDIGGTKTTAVVFNDQGEPVTDFIVKSSRTYEGENAVFQNTIELAYQVLEEAGMKKEDASESTRRLLQERQHRTAEGPVETNGKTST